MRKTNKCCLALYLIIYSYSAYATTCPDPKTTSLQWGVPPPPWVENPYSAHRPQGEENTSFIQATILRAGYGKGVLCTYRNSVGLYSIVWIVPTKIPAPAEHDWIEVLGGFICTRGLNLCNFYTSG